MQKRTKIVCTIGPASNKKKTVKAMFKNGMNMARLNFSHGTHESHRKLIEVIRQCSEELNQPVPILVDLQGPRIRLGELPKEGVVIKPGDKIIFSAGNASGTIPITYPNLYKDLNVGNHVLIADGIMDLKVTKISGKDIHCVVKQGGLLESHKGMNFPQASISLAALTAKDRKDIEFGVMQEVDYIAISFVKNAKEVKQLRSFIKKAEQKYKKQSKYPIHIIVKIERHEAITNLDEIIDSTDAVMVARGDLGIEISAEKVPIVQKEIIAKCRAVSKPVIVATQMLDSMIKNPRPTRAEVSDVANAVIDHSDAVMLSGESANGKYPVKAVETMARICMETEESSYDDIDLICQGVSLSIEDSIANATRMLAESLNAKMIIVSSIAGNAARLVATVRPEIPIVTVSDGQRVQRQLALTWGILPMYMKKGVAILEKAQVKKVVTHLKKEKMLNTDDIVVIVGGEPVKGTIQVNAVKIHQVK